jgi:hypothetical protein
MHNFEIKCLNRSKIAKNAKLSVETLTELQNSVEFGFLEVENSMVKLYFVKFGAKFVEESQKLILANSHTKDEKLLWELPKTCHAAL